MPVVLISAHVTMAPGLKRRLGILPPKSLSLRDVMADVDITAGLADLLDQKIAEVRTADGRVDALDLAAAVLNVARPSSVVQARVAAIHGRQSADLLPAMIEDTTAIHVLSRVLTEAIETHLGPNGELNAQDVAAHVIAAMRTHQKK